MKLLVFGRNGQVATELKKNFSINAESRFVGHDEVDFLSSKSIVDVIRDYHPTHIINAAAYTLVDKAESEQEHARQVNGIAVGIIGEEARKIGASVVHYSTDYVFDGEKNGSYIESDVVNPLNSYGQSKLLGERLLTESGCVSVILRVSWVYGASGANFLKTMLRLGVDREELRIVDDQVGAPTWSREIALASYKIMSDVDFKSKSGVYHLSPKGQVSWYGFAKSIFENYERMLPDEKLKVKRIIPIKSMDYPSPTQRPSNSRLCSDKIAEVFGVELPHWEESLKKVLVEI